MEDSRLQVSSGRKYFGLTTIQMIIVVVLGLMASLVLCGAVYIMVFTYAQLGPGQGAAVTSTVRARPTSPATWTPTPLSTTPSPEGTSTPTSSPTLQPADVPTPGLDGRHVESEGGFSYIPPSGWQVTEWPGLKYKIASGAPIGDFAPNLNFVDEAFSGSLDDYVAANIAAVKEAFQDVRVISQEDFFTDEGERDVKVVIENTQHDTEFYQAFYIFDAGEKKIAATYTRLADQGQENDALVDQSMRTFRIEK